MTRLPDLAQEGGVPGAARTRVAVLEGGVMGCEVRRGKPVYYRKERDGRRVRPIYCGSGERGQAAAREDGERRRQKALALVAADVPEKARTAGAEGVENPSTATAPVTAAVGAVYVDSSAADTPANPSISGEDKKQEKARTPTPHSPALEARLSKLPRVQRQVIKGQMKRSQGQKRASCERA